MTTKQKVTRKKKPGNHYIDREEFSDEMDIHSRECRANRAAGLPMPKCPDSIGKKFLLLATNVASGGKYFKYPFKEEMISDAVENMLRYRYNYDKELGAAFSYFTRYAIFAFWARIKLEKAELTKKAHLVQQASTHELSAHVLMDKDLGTDFKNDYLDYLVGWMERKEEDKEALGRDDSHKSGPVIDIDITTLKGPLGI